MSEISPSSVAARLIGWEADRHRVKRPVARAMIARQAGVAPGALERLERGTLKFVDRVAGKLNDLYVNKLRAKIAEHQHELAALEAVMGSISEADALAAADAIAEAQVAIAAAKRLIGKR